MAKVKILNQTEPTTPDTGYTNIYVDSADKKVKYKDDAGTVVVAASEDYVDSSVNVLKPRTFTLGENMSARDIATFGIDENVYKYIGSYFTNTVGSYSGTMYLQDYFMIDTNKIVFLYTGNEGGSTYYHYAVVGTISGITITLGTPLKYYSGGNLNGSEAKGCKLDSGKFAVAVKTYFGSINSEDIYGIVCTISGTTITAGSPVGMKTSNYTYSIYDIIKVATDKFVIRGQWDNGTNRAICCSVSGTTITKGSLASMTGDKLVYVSDDVFLSTNGNYIYRETISGTTITEGANLDNTNLTAYSRTYVDSTRQILTGLNSGNLVSVVINGTPTTPTQGSYYTIKTTCDSSQGACLIGTNKLVYNYGVAGASEFQGVAVLDTNVINKQYEIQISSTTPVGIKPISTGDRYIYKGHGNTNVAITNIFTLPSEYNSVFGLLYESGSLGESKQIYTKGFILSGFTGLIPGMKYYIYSGFILSVSNGSGIGYGKEIGIALTSTTLLITV